ncbi:glycosyltransferase family 2 protein [Aeromonas sp. QDB33]|uniref:glycosyltransferase family 2 protein n=1 Tax=Aeromonas sp. QDB33 TaxID=2990488 RepID=UPI0022E3D034|nr:glycosyltransferase family 2 protein [Aeromonas sp. QDB33]
MVNQNLNDKKNVVCGIVAAFNFDDSALQNSILISSLLDYLIIIDDGSADISKLEQLLEMKLHNVRVVYSNENQGIANSLNLGAKLALSMGYEWCITFDQDSTPDSHMVSLLQHQRDVLLEIYGEKVAIVAPNIIDLNARGKVNKYLVEEKRFTFSRKSPYEITEGDKVLVVITSGALTNLKVLRDLGFFATELFIDYVDTEYCIRLVVNGYKIGVAKDAVLNHNLGQKKRKIILGVDFVATNHSPFRRYYIARNSIYMYRKYAAKVPSWFIFDLIATLYNSVRIILCEKDRFKKVKFCVRGYLDGILGRMGKIDG